MFKKNKIKVCLALLSLVAANLLSARVVESNFTLGTTQFYDKKCKHEKSETIDGEIKNGEVTIFIKDARAIDYMKKYANVKDEEGLRVAFYLDTQYGCEGIFKDIKVSEGGKKLSFSLKKDEIDKIKEINKYNRDKKIKEIKEINKYFAQTKDIAKTDIDTAYTDCTIDIAEKGGQCLIDGKFHMSFDNKIEIKKFSYCWDVVWVNVISGCRVCLDVARVKVMSGYSVDEDDVDKYDVYEDDVGM